MAESNIAVTAGSGESVDTFTLAGGNKRQAVVIGDQSIGGNAASVQQTDPTSNTQGIVVRDVNTSAIVASLGGSISVYVAATAGTLNVQLKPGTIAVSLDPGHLLGSVTANAGTGTMTVVFDPGHELGSIKAINSTVGIYFDSSQGTINVQLKPGTIAVSLDPGHLLGSVTANAGTGTMTVIFDPGHELGSIKGTNSSLAVFLDPGHLLGSVTANAGTGSFTVQLDPGHTIGIVDSINKTVTVQLDRDKSTLTGILGSVAVYFDRGNPSVNATFSGTIEVVPTTGSRKTTDDAAAAQRVLIVGSQTNASIQIVGITQSIAVYFDRGNPSVNATFAPSGTLAFAPITGSSHPMWEENYNAQRIFFAGSNPNSSLVVNAGTGSFNVQFDPGHTIGKVEPGVGTFQIFIPDTGHEIGTIRGNTNTLTVFLPDTGHTVGKVDQGVGGTSAWLVNDSATAVIPITATGSAAGVSVSGNTVAGPTASRVLKVYAFSLTTTAQTSLTVKFTNGAGTSPTVFYEMALQAPAQGIAGSNMVVSPPGYLFATAAGATLSMLLDSASKVHYSVYYFEESA